MELQTISRVSKEFEVSTRTLRYYGQIGLLPAIRNNSDYAYRMYDEHSLHLLRQILALRRFRISLKQINVLLKSEDRSVKVGIFSENLEKTKKEIFELQEVKNGLELFLEELQNSRESLPDFVSDKYLKILNSISAPSIPFIKLRKKMTMSNKEKEEETFPLYARPNFDAEKRSALNTFPEEPMNSDTAYHIVHDKVMMDGNARLNLATFGTTWMEEYADKLYAEVYDKNMIDKDEYPATAKIETKTWKMLADLWHCEDPEHTIGSSAVGSSEACMLGALALKRRWEEKRQAEGKPSDRPNLIISAAEQVVWLKFANYFGVELRRVPISLEHRCLDGYRLEDYVDENTIGVIAILGVTYTGMYEPVKQIADKLDEIQEKTGLDIKIHVDAATGGFVTPFLQPELEWDFRVPRVASINASGHKYGLVYQSVGWTVWRDAKQLPESLVFHVSYLGGNMPTFTLNFSKPGAQILLQYFNFLRLGFNGYKAIMEATREIAQHIADEMMKMPEFELWNQPTDSPVFAWMLKEDLKRRWTLYDLSDRLRMKGWQVPAYPMPENLTNITVQRVIIRNGFSMDLANELLDDIRSQVRFLEEHNVTTAGNETVFHH